MLVQNPVKAEEPNAPKGNGQDGRWDRLQAMKEHLDLTPEQVEKVKAVFAGDKEKYMAVRQDSALSDEQKREKMRELMKGAAEQIKAILTPEQEVKWKEQMKKRMDERKGAAGAESK